MKPLRIAYVAARWDYGDPARGLSFEETNFRSALEGAGHEVHAYDFMTRHRELGGDAMNDELVGSGHGSTIVASERVFVQGLGVAMS